MSHWPSLCRLLFGSFWVSFMSRLHSARQERRLFFTNHLSWCRSAVFGRSCLVFLLVMLNTSIALVLVSRSKIRFVPLALTAVLCVASFLWARREWLTLSMPIGQWPSSNIICRSRKAGGSEIIRLFWIAIALLHLRRRKQTLDDCFSSYALPFDAYRNPRFLKNWHKRPRLSSGLDLYPKIPDRRIADVGQYEVAILSPRKGKSLVWTSRFKLRLPEYSSSFREGVECARNSAGQDGVLLCYEIPLLRRHEGSEKGRRSWRRFRIPVLYQNFFNRVSFIPGSASCDWNGLYVIRVSANGYSAIIDRGEDC